MQRGLSPTDHLGQSLFVDRRADRDERQSARELHEQMRRVGDLAVSGDFARAGGDYAARELRVAGRQHQRLEAVRQQVAYNARVVGIILVPAEVVLRVEWDLRGLALPAIPIQVLLGDIRIDGESPLAVILVVAAERTLAPDQRAELARLDPLRGPVPFRVHAALRADDVSLACLLDGVIYLERLNQIPCHRLLAEDMLARLQRVDRYLGVPGIDGGNHHGIDVLSFQQFPVVPERIRLGDAGALPGGIQVALVNVAYGHLRDIVVLGVLLLEGHVQRVLLAHADVGDVDTVIGANHAARRKRLVLTINGSLEKASGAHRRDNRGGLLDEGAACFPRVHRRVWSGV